MNLADTLLVNIDYDEQPRTFCEFLLQKVSSPRATN